jgi:hypothetical protein
LWLVEDTREQIEVHIQTGAGFGERREFTSAERIVSKVLPDMTLLPARLFAD